MITTNSERYKLTDFSPGSVWTLGEHTYTVLAQAQTDTGKRGRWLQRNGDSRTAYFLAVSGSHVSVDPCKWTEPAWTARGGDYLSQDKITRVAKRYTDVAAQHLWEGDAA